MLSVLRFYQWFSSTETELWEEGACVMWEQWDARTAGFLWLRSQGQSHHLLSICTSQDHRRECDGVMTTNLIVDFVCTECSEHVQWFLDFACNPYIICRVEIVKHILFFKPHCFLQQSKQSKPFHRLSKGVVLWVFLIKYILNQEFLPLIWLFGMKSV